MSALRADQTPATEGAAVVPSLDALYRAHAPAVARWAAHLGGPRLDVEDAVHEVFLVVSKRLTEFRGDAKVTTWLYRITERVVRGGRRRERVRRWLDLVRRGDVQQSLSPPRPTPVEELERRQSRETVYRILDRLAEKYRRVLVLFELEELSGEEIAALTGLKLATVWVHLHRARATVPGRDESRGRRTFMKLQRWTTRPTRSETSRAGEDRAGTAAAAGRREAAPRRGRARRDPEPAARCTSFAAPTARPAPRARARALPVGRRRRHVGHGARGTGRRSGARPRARPSRPPAPEPQHPRAVSPTPASPSPRRSSRLRLLAGARPRPGDSAPRHGAPTRAVPVVEPARGPTRRTARGPRAARHLRASPRRRPCVGAALRKLREQDDAAGALALLDARDRTVRRRGDARRGGAHDARRGAASPRPARARARAPRRHPARPSGRGRRAARDARRATRRRRAVPRGRRRLRRPPRRRRGLGRHRPSARSTGAPPAARASATSDAARADLEAYLARFPAGRYAARARAALEP